MTHDLEYAVYESVLGEGIIEGVYGNPGWGWEGGWNFSP